MDSRLSCCIPGHDADAACSLLLLLLLYDYDAFPNPSASCNININMATSRREFWTRRQLPKLYLHLQLKARGCKCIAQQPKIEIAVRELGRSTVGAFATPSVMCHAFGSSSSFTVKGEGQFCCGELQRALQNTRDHPSALGSALVPMPSAQLLCTTKHTGPSQHPRHSSCASTLDTALVPLHPFLSCKDPLPTLQITPTNLTRCVL
jgi:hypothetical protein